LNPQAAARHARLVLFDLDGTLVDTAEDLAEAINRCRQSRNLPPIPPPQLRPWSSHGARGMIRHAFGIDPSEPGYDELRAEFLDHYQSALSVHSRLYPGMDRTLAAIESSGRRWGVVTNKAGRFTLPLLQALNLEARAACVVSGDSVSAPKPDPAPIHHALQSCQVAADETVYVGDDLRDVQAGRAAGVLTVVAAYGYLSGATDLAGWGADHIIGQPLELLDLLGLKGG
jgi:N-acetyl-D-muramate 6-phosphate phosphatase